jgi:AraC-like DNA-binding protein
VELHACRDGSITACDRDELIVTLCLSGKTRFREPGSDTCIEMAQSHVTIFRPNIPFAFSWTKEWRGFCLLVGAAFGEEVIGPRWEEVVAQRDRRSVIGDAPLIHAMTAFYRDCADSIPSRSLFQDCLVNAIVAHVGDLSIGEAPRDDEARLDGVQLSRVVTFLDENIGERLSLAAIAGVIDLAPIKFCRLFKASTGMSPYQFLLDRRIRRAQRLLSAPGTDISDLAVSLGFYDQSQFNRMFKRKTGIPPGKYRRLTQSASIG